MPLSPARMGDAILRNLAPKTGRSLEHWLDLLHQSGAEGKPAAIAHLKSAGLGHFQAQKVYEASIGDDPYGDPEALAAALFPGGLREAYAAFAKTCHALGDDVREIQCRTYAGFSAATQFAIVAPGSEGGLRVGLALRQDAVAQPRLADVVAPAYGLGGSARVNAAFELPDAGVPTAAQRAVLTEAYRYNRARA